MSSGWLVLLEGAVVFGGLLAFAVWQLRSLKRLDAADADEGGRDSGSPPPGHPEGEQGADPAGSEPVER